MTLVYLENGYQGDIELFVEKVKLLCMDTEARNYLERCVKNAQIAFKAKLPQLRELENLFCCIDEPAENNNIQPLKTRAIVINPKDDLRLYRQIKKLQASPGKKERVLNWLEAFSVYDDDELETAAL